MLDTEQIRVEYIPIEEIAKWPRNPKDHDHHEIQKSFYRFGFIKPILIDEESQQLVAGHGRLDALKLLKQRDKEPPKGVQVEDDVWRIPVLRGVRFDNVEEAEAFLIADNRLTEIGGWDNDLLADMLGEIVDVDGALEGIGFDYAEVLDLVDPKPKGNIDGKVKARAKGENYLIMVVCADEEEQSTLLEKFMAEGIQCRGVVE
jgi:hypothetical protein